MNPVHLARALLSCLLIYAAIAALVLIGLAIA